MPHVLLLRPIHLDAVARLEAAPGVTVAVAEDLSPAALAGPLARAEAVIVRVHPVDAAFVAAAPALRIVARHGVGYDLVDVPALTARGIPLTITADANAASVAEHALALMLACARHLPAHDAAVRRGDWAGARRPTAELAGRRALLVGFGRIGARVAPLCAAFGMRVAVHDPRAAPAAIRAAGAEPAPDLAAALGVADVVSLHCPATDATRGLVDAAFLAALPPGAILVNTARGALVDEAALADALRSGRLAAAGLDVFAEEPIPADHPLLVLPTLVATPHVAAGTAEAMRRMALSAADSVLARFAGTLGPEAVVNPEALG